MDQIFLLSALLLGALAVDSATLQPPVLLLGVEVPQVQKVFQAISKKQFAELLEKLQLDRFMIVAYLAKDLMPQDFRCQLPDSSQRCYAHVGELKPLSYFSQVQEPLAALQLSALEKIVWHDLNEVPACQPGRIHAFNFSDTHAERYRNLWTHDRFIAEVGAQLKNCSVVQMYTALRAAPARLLPPVIDESAYKWHQRTDAEDEDVPQEPRNLTILRSDLGVIGFLKILYAMEVRSGSTVYYKRTKVLVNGTDVSVHQVDARNPHIGFVFTLTTHKGPLSIQILGIMGNWRISKLVFKNNATFHTRDLSFYSKQNSYCCPTLTAYSETGARLSIYRLHIDVVTNENQTAHDPEYKVRPCWQCDQYVTPGISQAIFTHFFLVTILAFGIAMIWDIGRNSRIQNPNTAFELSSQ